MNIFVATVSYCTVLTIIANAVEIERGFPLDCGIPVVEREYKEEAEQMKVPATPDSWPWHVGIWSKGRGSYPYCGGTLISKFLILTAAHCVRSHFGCTRVPVGTEFQVAGATPYIMQIHVGAYDYTRSDGTHRFYTVQRAIIHPNFNADAIHKGYDIAILKVWNQISMNAAVRPICFPSSRVILPKGSLCFYVGWGRLYTDWSEGKLVSPKHLRESQVEIDFDEKCMQLYNFFNSDCHSCIKSHGSNPCHGDNGGGLFCPSEENKSWFWYGAFSFGSKDCLANWTVFNDISGVHSWIRESAINIGL